MISVVIISVIMLNVVAPWLQTAEIGAKNQDLKEKVKESFEICQSKQALVDAAYMDNHNRPKGFRVLLILPNFPSKVTTIIINAYFHLN